jgi:hypothetical protein
MTEKKSGSKFSGLLASVKDRQSDDKQEAAQDGKQHQNSTKTAPIAMALTEVAVVNAHSAEEVAVAGAKRGRPRGKRSNEEFVQVTAYIEKQTHRDVKIALLTEGEGREFSELVENLLAEWIVSRS